MKKIILSFITIFFLAGPINAMELSTKQNQEQDPLPQEIWHAIISKLINFDKVVEEIKAAKTLPELKVIMQDIFAVSLANKKCNEAANYFVNKEFEINRIKIKLKDIYVKRKNEILQEIEKKLNIIFPNDFFRWFYDINSKKSILNQTALIRVSEEGNKKLVELLIQNGADVNIMDSLDETALIKAARNGHIEIAKLLIENGADVNIKSSSSSTALITAAGWGQEKMVEFLIKCGAELNARDWFDYTALMCAVKGGHKEIVRTLVQHGADLDIKDNMKEIGFTALMWAAYDGYEEIIEILIENGADINIKSNDGRTALMIEKEHNHQSVAKLIEFKDYINNYHQRHECSIQ